MPMCIGFILQYCHKNAKKYDTPGISLNLNMDRSGRKVMNLLQPINQFIQKAVFLFFAGLKHQVWSFSPFCIDAVWFLWIGSCGHLILLIINELLMSKSNNCPNTITQYCPDLPFNRAHEILSVQGTDMLYGLEGCWGWLF